MITSRERVQAAVHADPVDRIPFAVWRHFYPEEADPRALAETTIAFTKRHKLDLIKYNPRAHYHGEPWGTRYEYEGAAKPRLVKNAVERTEDWAKIGRKKIDEPAFQELLTGLRQLLRRWSLRAARGCPQLSARLRLSGIRFARFRSLYFRADSLDSRSLLRACVLQALMLGDAARVERMRA